MKLPDMARVEQRFDPDHVQDIPAAVKRELSGIGIKNKIRPGQRVAITAGSRGIDNIAPVTRSVVNFVKEAGGEPFIFPAMGSHGGATDDGQTALLAGYGITASSMGCEIRSTMEVNEIGRNLDGLPVYLDRCAGEAEHIIVINRIKPHTKFEGPIESGLMKMMAIGMGKHAGAKLYHQATVRYGMNRVIETVGLVMMEKAPLLCGLGLVENGYDRTAIVRAALPPNLVETEKELLKEARRRMARIPFADIDLLIVDEIGKNISGTGMDTNVTGVNRDILGTFSAEPRTKRLFVRDLTPETEGNALGIGFADFTTTRLVEKIDRKTTYINCLTGISPEKGAIPIYFDTDRECIESAIRCLGMISVPDIRVVHIRNTLALSKISVSKAYLTEIQNSDTLDLASGWVPMAFNSGGNLISPFTD